MTPEEKKLLQDTAQKLDKLIDIFYRIHFIDKEVFPNDVYMNGKLIIKDSSISLGSNTGGSIGITGEKVGFLGATPLVRQSAISAPSGGATVDSQSRAAINSLIAVLKNFGFTA